MDLIVKYLILIVILAAGVALAVVMWNMFNWSTSKLQSHVATPLNYAKLLKLLEEGKVHAVWKVDGTLLSKQQAIQFLRKEINKAAK